jgi:hypothetical protein
VIRKLAMENTVPATLRGAVHVRRGVHGPPSSA